MIIVRKTASNKLWEKSHSKPVKEPEMELT